MRGMKSATLLGAVLFALARTAAAGEIVDATGKTVKVAEPVTRVAVAGPPAEVLIYFVAPDALAGWVRDVSPQVAPYLSAKAKALPVLGGVSARGDISTVLNAKPQLILDYGDIDQRYIEQAEAMRIKTGVPYALLDGDLAKAPQMLRAVGNLTGRTARGKELAVYAEGILARAKTIATAHAADPAKVFIARSADGSDTPMPGTHAGDVYDLAGIKNVAQSRTVTPDQVQAWDPDVIVTLDAKFHDTAKTPAWSSVRAAKSGHIIDAPHVPWGWTDHPPSVQRLLGVLWLTSHIYGEPTAVALKDETKRFYKLFFQIDLTEQQLAEMLAK